MPVGPGEVLRWRAHPLWRAGPLSTNAVPARRLNMGKIAETIFRDSLGPGGPSPRPGGAAIAHLFFEAQLEGGRICASVALELTERRPKSAG